MGRQNRRRHPKQAAAGREISETGENKDGKKKRDLHLMGIPMGKRRDRGEDIPDNMSENVPEPMQQSVDPPGKYKQIPYNVLVTQQQTKRRHFNKGPDRKDTFTYKRGNWKGSASPRSVGQHPKALRETAGNLTVRPATPTSKTG